MFSAAGLNFSSVESEVDDSVPVGVSPFSADEFEIARPVDVSQCRPRRSTISGIGNGTEIARARPSGAVLRRKRRSNGSLGATSVYSALFLIGMCVLCLGLCSKTNELSNLAAAQTEQQRDFYELMVEIRDTVESIQKQFEEAQKNQNLKQNLYCQRHVTQSYANFLVQTLEKDAREMGV